MIYEHMHKVCKLLVEVNVGFQIFSTLLFECNRYYPALKTLEQLEHTYLPRVASYRFAKQMRDNIPRVREDIKHASMTDIKDFLEAIRR